MHDVFKYLYCKRQTRISLFFMIEKWSSIPSLCNKPKNKEEKKPINEYAVWKLRITKTFSLSIFLIHVLLIFTSVVKDAYDYQGRSFLHIPQDVGVNLRSEDPPEKCFLPKKQIHTWTGHTKGVSAIRWFPLSAHLLLSCSMDCKIKVLAWNHFKIRFIHNCKLLGQYWILNLCQRMFSITLPFVALT